MWPALTATILLTTLSPAARASAQAFRGANHPPAFVPLGAYWPWERTKPLADFCKLDKWAYVDRALALLASHHVNTIWTVNFPIADLVPMLQACRRHHIYLLPCFGEIHYDIPWRHNNWQYFDKQIARIDAQLKQAGEAADNLLGYILCDEPRPQVVQGVEMLRQRFAKFDPLRPAFTVSTWSATPTVIEKTRQPVICTDLYPFFGPDDPNGPHTPQTSRSFYTGNLARLSGLLQGTGRPLWAMFQCFVEIWGPWRYDEHFRQVALPGAYLHWVCPSPAQMRWQVWEALRCGARGFICFLALPQPPDPQSAHKPPPDVKWKDVLVTRETLAGPAALINPDLSPTDQLKAMGKAYHAIGQIAETVLRWRPDEPWFGGSTAPAEGACFRDPTTGRRYLVMVNQDFRRLAHLAVRFRRGIRRIRLVTADADIKIWLDESANRAKFTLPPGDGCVLAVAQPAEP